MVRMERQAIDAELQRVNALSLWDFEAEPLVNGTLIIRGSNDFTYSHYLELEFLGVTFSNVPERFSHAQFQIDRQEIIWIDAESEIYKIVAASLTVRIGRVSYTRR